MENEQKLAASEEKKSFSMPLLCHVRRALETFLPTFKHWHIQRSPLHFIVEKDGQELFIEQLSDGEKCLIALVGDLARRLVMTNANADEPLKCGTGVVMIDEIELHLHPHWQKDVLPKLLQTFPGIQFVITTHSSYVLSQMNSLLLLDRQNQQNSIGVFDMGNQGKSLVDNESGLIMPSSMDDAADDIEQEFARLQAGSGR